MPNYTLITLSLALTIALCARARPAPQYQPVAVTSISDIAYPLHARAAGMVTLDIFLDASGSLQRVTAVRGIPPLTEAARQAVQSWKFSPASEAGKAVRGIARVNVVFNPFNPGGVSILNQALPATENRDSKATARFQPADVSSASYAIYPPNTVASGTVILEAQIGADGSLESIKVLQDISALTSVAKKALKSWQFNPASYEGQPTSSQQVVAFVFISPQHGTP